VTRLAVELALETRTDPAIWRNADTATLNTALEILEDRPDR